MDDARVVGDTSVVKTEYGYHVMYYSAGDEGWIICCRNGVRAEKLDKLMKEMSDANEAQYNFKKLELVSVDLTSSQ